MQPHPRHVGRNLRDLDPVVDVHGRLRDARHVCMAMRARLGQDVARVGRVRMQRPMRPGMHLGLRRAGRLFAGLQAARGGGRRVVRRLRRKRQLPRNAAFSARSAVFSSRSAVFSSRSAAFSVRSAAFSLSRSCTRALQRLDLSGQQVHPPKQCAISASVLARDRNGDLDDRLTHLLTHAGRSDVSAPNSIESNRRTHYTATSAKLPR